MSDPYAALRELLTIANDPRDSDELLGNVFRSHLAELEELGKPTLAPDIDTPAPLQMARWLDERAEINFKYAHLPPQAWEIHTLPYIAVRLKQAAEIIRRLCLPHTVEQRLGEALLRFIEAVDDEKGTPAQDYIEHMIANLLKDVRPFLKRKT